jgi:hypothetical protein
MKKILLFLLFIFLFFPVTLIAEDEIIPEEDWYNEEEFGKDWYKEMGLGSGDCGPASVAMGIQYQTGMEVSVKDVRRIIGKTPKGSTSFGNLIYALRVYNAVYKLISLDNTASIEDAIDRDSIVIVLVRPDEIPTGNNASHLGRLYPDFNSKYAHFIVIKGYTATFFLVNDPMPGSANRLYIQRSVYKSLKAFVGIEIVR